MRILAFVCLFSTSAFAQPAIRLIQPDGSLVDVSSQVTQLTAFRINNRLVVQVGSGPTANRLAVPDLGPGGPLGITVPGGLVGFGPGQKLLVGAEALSALPADETLLAPQVVRVPSGSIRGLALFLGSFTQAEQDEADSRTHLRLGQPAPNAIVIMDTTAGFWTGLPEAHEVFTLQVPSP